jgi:hypothetical protein
MPSPYRCAHYAPADGWQPEVAAMERFGTVLSGVLPVVVVLADLQVHAAIEETRHRKVLDLGAIQHRGCLADDL